MLAHQPARARPGQVEKLNLELEMKSTTGGGF